MCIRDRLYIDNTPFLVNLGTSCYGLSKRRQFERSTKAHNTVVINNQDSSEIWGGFRVARRARPSLIDCLQDKSNVIIRARHTGYRRLNNKLTHQRQWCFEENSIEIKDEVAPFFDEGYAIYHFHPSFKLIEFNEESLVLLSPGHKTIIVEYDNAADIVDNEYAQSFGDIRPCLSLKVELSKVTGTCCTKIQW